MSTVKPLTRTELIDWLRLTRTENVGPITFYRLLERFGTVSAALAALPDLARRGGRSLPLRVPSRGEVEREMATLGKLQGRFVAACEPEYPPALTRLEDAPPVLATLGAVSLLQRPAVGIVGARNASIAGRKMAERLARELADAGFLVVSGLARGIDGAAHAGAMAGERSKGGTAAVVAGGVDVVYPPEHEELQREIAARGLVLGECAMGTEPQARHFPRRNRLISGLSLGIVVVEAALKSGSLITARLALEQGREVFAVPGSPTDPRAQGCNRLIKEGATLVETADDVVEVLRPLAGSLRERLSVGYRQPAAPVAEAAVEAAELERARGLVLEGLSPAPVLIDEVVRCCQLSPGIVRTVLLELELAGRVQHHPGSRISLL